MLSFPAPREAEKGVCARKRSAMASREQGSVARTSMPCKLRSARYGSAGRHCAPASGRGENRRGPNDHFFNTRTGLPASHALMSSTICV